MISQKKTSDFAQDPGVAFWQAQLTEAQERPWLASFMLRHSEALYERFAHFYSTLQALPRRTRRRLQRRLATTLAGAALVLALSGAPAMVGAQDGRSGRGVDRPPTPVVNDEIQAVTGIINVTGGCTLIDAIKTAETGIDEGSCSGGSGGPDELILDASSTHSFSTGSYPGIIGDNALPLITTPITIEGNGSTIERSGTSDHFRLFEVSGGSLTLNDVTVSGGSISTSTNFGFGGGILVYSGSLTVNRSTISDNSATSSASGARGGGICLFDGTVTVQDSAIINNDATGAGTGSGGGIGLDNTVGSLLIKNSTISGNTSSTAGSFYGGGAGVYAIYGTSTVTINNSTISNNTHTGGTVNLAGGVYTFYTGNLTIGNTIISGNSGVTVNDCYTTNLGGTTSSLIGLAECSGTAPTTLNLGALATNGGPTMTHALLTGSTDAIDAITAGTGGCVASVSTDQRGYPRAGGIGYGGSACDIGAFEYNSQPVAITLQGFSATTAAGPEKAAAASLLGMISLGISSLWLRRRRSSS